MRHLREVIPLQELSKPTLSRYRDEADDEVESLKQDRSGAKKGTPERTDIERRISKHTAGSKLAGRKLREETELNEVDTISLSVPLFIRMLEYAKEDAKTDMDLHKATERILDLSDGDDILDMDSYNDIVEDVELDEAKRPVYKRKGSLRAKVRSAADQAARKSKVKKTVNAAYKEYKDTGKKVKFSSFGNWAHKRAAAKRKMQEDRDPGLTKRVEELKKKKNKSSEEKDKLAYFTGSSIKEAKSEYKKTKSARGEGPRAHFYVDIGRRAGHARELNAKGIDARHEYSPYSNLAGISVPKQHEKKVSEYLWPKSRKKK